jgi:integrase
LYGRERLRSAAPVIRPEECFRLRWEHCQKHTIEIIYGKTDNARRRISLSQRVQPVLAMRRTQVEGP